MAPREKTLSDQAGRTAALRIAEGVARDPGRVDRALEDSERDSYRNAKRSVIDARRHAESHEGNLKIC